MKAVLIYVLLAISLMTILTNGGMNLSSDSKTYLTAGNLLRYGKFERAVDKVLPDHAPLYALALGSAQFLTGGALDVKDWGASWRELVVQRVPWARWVSVLGFALTVAGMFFLGWRIDGSLTAHLSAILILIFPPVVKIFTWAWSETLFLPISIFCLLAILLYSEKRSVSWLLLSAILCALGFFTRFIGVSLVFSGFLIVLLITRSWSRLINIVPWALIASSPLWLYAGLDRSITPGQHGFFYQMLEFLKVCCRDLGPIGIVILVWGLFFEGLRWKAAAEIRRWWCTAVYVLVYSVILVAVSSATSIDPLDGHGSRLVVPIYPFLILIISSILTGPYRTKREQLAGESGCKG